MVLNEALKNVTVLGAAGKMGSGISLLLLQEMARLELEQTGRLGSGGFVLNLVDTNETALGELRRYLRKQLVKYAEKNIVMLRIYTKDNPALVDNSDVIESFVNDSQDLLRTNTDPLSAKSSKLVFEAIIEDLDVKLGVYNNLNRVCPPDTMYFTNTSSIPISEIDSKAGLGGRIIGYHFYNPPAVQKLVELISSAGTTTDIKNISMELGKRLKKTIVPSNDKAGFIGNGHFLRDVLYSFDLVSELQKRFAPHEAVYCVNKITQDFMVRPMGIFQLHDYVGVDVCRHILAIMKTYLGNPGFENETINAMYKNKIIGGQFADGSQKDGFLKYEKNKPVGVYSLQENRYILFSEGDWTRKCDDHLGALPKSYTPWKALLGDKKKADKLGIYFKELFSSDAAGCVHARKYLECSRSIARELVKDGVANRIEDVNQVLENGFFHVYGPENTYF
ncbi:MAG: hypothetical protein A2583_15550 [Bdellovibrionales bacterium RIFOXYD1_FULL_53_11]|nr:MAG: hypothetical protein A2583_15550 [Bdellovibrionales bacterium RIFOXYD1_FULL_53_11]